MDFDITSTSNPRMKGLIHLRDRKTREEKGFFLIEGYREIERALLGGISLSSLYISPPLFLGTNESSLIEKVRGSGVEIITCAPNVFQKVSYRDRPDGLLAIAPIYNRGMPFLEEILQRSSLPFLAVAEGIEKPGNLGSILRSCDGAGVDGVVLADPCTDLFNPNVIRSSVGTLFTQPVIQSSGEELISFLRRWKIQIVAATPHADREFTESDLSGPVAIIVGTEQLGLSSLWMEKADIQVRIPMKGIADSLNVSTAATLLLYEVLRQRKHVL